jgi:tRNA dimethylallyltransferase
MHIDGEALRASWFLAGPTACGKTAAGLALSERCGAEIVALDSMSLYRGMDIGTAKPTAAERSRVPHHLIDILEPHEEFSVAEYLRAADRACREILSRGGRPLFVGGTGLYLRALLRGVFEGPGADWEFRRLLQEELQQGSPEQLHARLRQVDPETAGRLAPRDVRRVIRALEVRHLTGRPASELKRQPPLPPENRPRHVYWLSPPRAWLHARINERVTRMIEQGLVAEVRRLLGAPRPPGRTACQALGYKEIMDHLAGRCTLDEAVALIQARTRQFAKRQHTWFRNLVECRAIPMTGEETPEELAQQVIDAAEIR